MATGRLAGILWRTSARSVVPWLGWAAAAVIVVGITRQWSPNLARDDMILGLGTLIAGAGSAITVLRMSRWPLTYDFEEVIDSTSGGSRRLGRALVVVIAGWTAALAAPLMLTIAVMKWVGSIGRPDIAELVCALLAVLLIGLLCVVFGQIVHDERRLVGGLVVLVAVELVPYLLGLHRSVRWIAPWVPATLRGSQPSPEAIFRQMWPHALFLTGLIAACVVVLTASHTVLRILGSIGGLATAAVALIISGQAPSAATIEHRLATIERAVTSDTTCTNSTTTNGLRICPYPGYERWSNYFDAIAGPAIGAGRQLGLDGPITIRQLPTPPLTSDDQNPDGYLLQLAQITEKVANNPGTVTAGTDIGEFGVNHAADDQLVFAVLSSLAELPNTPESRPLPSHPGAIIFGSCDATGDPRAARVLAAAARVSPRIAHILATVDNNAEAYQNAAALSTGIVFGEKTFAEARSIAGLPEMPLTDSSLPTTIEFAPCNPS